VAAQTVSGLALGTLIYLATGSALLSALGMFGPSLAQLIGATTFLSAADRLPPRATGRPAACRNWDTPSAMTFRPPGYRRWRRCAGKARPHLQLSSERPPQHTPILGQTRSAREQEAVGGLTRG
jgi:hypothetical protein